MLRQKQKEMASDPYARHTVQIALIMVPAKTVCAFVRGRGGAKLDTQVVPVPKGAVVTMCGVEFRLTEKRWMADVSWRGNDKKRRHTTIGLDKQHRLLHEGNTVLVRLFAADFAANEWVKKHVYELNQRRTMTVAERLRRESRRAR